MVFKSKRERERGRQRFGGGGGIQRTLAELRKSFVSRVSLCFLPGRKWDGELVEDSYFLGKGRHCGLSGKVKLSCPE